MPQAMKLEWTCADEDPRWMRRGLAVDASLDIISWTQFLESM